MSDTFSTIRSKYDVHKVPTEKSCHMHTNHIHTACVEPSMQIYDRCIAAQHLYVSAHARMYTRTYVCRYDVCMRVRMDVYMYVYMKIFTDVMYECSLQV